MQKTTLLEPGNYYHIYTRGNNHETIFLAPENYSYFLQLYRKYVSPYTDTFAYCLLPNHVHFLVRIKDADELTPLAYRYNTAKHISVNQQFSHLLNAYTKAINKRYNRSGSLFQQRFGRKVVVSEAYFSRLIFYIHANPQHHGLVRDFMQWPYSSYRSMLSDKNTNLMRETVLEWFGGRELYARFHQENQVELETIAKEVAGNAI